MARIWIALALGLTILALGCPKRLPDAPHDTGLVPLDNTAAQPGEPGGEGVLTGADDLLAEAGTTEEADSSGVMDTGAAQEAEARAGEPLGPVGPQPPMTGGGADGTVDGEAAAEETPTDDGQTPGDEASEAGPAADEGQVDPKAEPGAQPGSDNEGSLLDPDAGGDGLIEGPPGYGAQGSQAAAGLAGTWQVVSATRNGESREYAPGDWELRLEQDGSAQISRKDAGQQRQQSGSWEAGGDGVSFDLGPGGHQSYTVSGDDPDVQVFVDAQAQTALFAVRLAPGAAVPQLFQRYDSDFGALKFAQAGPGVWTGSYGDPAGKLHVSLTGPFCTGTWEQGASRGGVILRLTSSGFTGWWWYAGNLDFDGSWNGTIGK